MQWVRISFEIVMGAIGGFAGFTYGLVSFLIGGYQGFQKDKSFASSIYSYQESVGGYFDGLDEA